MSSREEFEASYSELMGTPASVLKNLRGGDEYRETEGHRMQVAWLMWQAASKASDQQLAAVVEECASVKAMNDCLSEELRGYESDGAFDGPKMHLLWWQCETPATDAAIANIQAQGVDAAIERLIQKFEGTGHIGVPVMVLEHFAAQLRQGAAL